MSQNLIHLISATKYRRPVPPHVAQFIEQDIKKVMLLYWGITPEAVAFDENHMHVLFDLPRTITLEEVARRLKASVSKHVRAKFPEVKKIHPDAFWQQRFLYVSLGGKTEAATRRYIDNQKAFNRGG